LRSCVRAVLVALAEGFEPLIEKRDESSLEELKMEISEFIDAYSDDLIYLLEARNALLTHPLRNDYILQPNLDASFCRLLAVFMVGSIEANADGMARS
jgi:hypothetical protein